MNYEPFAAFINRTSIRMTKNFHLREDLAQEMRLNLWQLPDDTDTEEAMKSAYNTARRYVRRMRFPRVR